MLIIVLRNSLGDQTFVNIEQIVLVQPLMHGTTYPPNTNAVVYLSSGLKLYVQETPGTIVYLINHAQQIN